MIKIKTFLVLFIFCCLFTTSLYATEEYAEQTERDCVACHLNPSGGTELTAAGEGYAAFITADGAEVNQQTGFSFGKTVRFLAGYLHILFGFFWFGTILYVHLILKPGYASRGLPRGEVKLGLASIIIMGITGAILFVYRVPDPSILLETKFGILLLLKIILYLILVFSALVAVFVLGPRLRNKKAVQSTDPQTEEMTMETLQQFDGKDGRAAYFAYNGEVFDATNSHLWKNGSHMGRHQAGSDLTEVLSQAPHGEDLVLELPKVGKLAPDEADSLTPPQKLFYAMAYMNLGFVLLVILILAGWNWL
jgi:predicted heme/steroid binding protein